MIKRVALVGASSTGKTTVFELLKNRLPKWEFVNESTRTVKGFGYPINEEGEEATQLAISVFHIKALLLPNHLILDRCFLDVVVYSSIMSDRVPSRTMNYLEEVWKQVQEEYTHYIYFPIEFNAVDDGVRSISEEWREKVDEEFQDRLRGMKYLRVTGSPIQRVEQILNYIKQ